MDFTEDVNKPKVRSAKEKINQLNPDVKMVTFHQLFTADNAIQIIDY